MDGSPRDATSPDGSLRVEFEENEYRMSHWVCSPRLIDLRTGEVLLDLWGGTMWDAEASFPDGGGVVLRLRRYPGDKPGFTVHVDASSRTFYFEGPQEGREPLAGFKRRLEERHRRQGRIKGLGR